MQSRFLTCSTQHLVNPEIINNGIILYIVRSFGYVVYAEKVVKDISFKKVIYSSNFMTTTILSLIQMSKKSGVNPA